MQLSGVEIDSLTVSPTAAPGAPPRAAFAARLREAGSHVVQGASAPAAAVEGVTSLAIEAERGPDGWRIVAARALLPVSP